ncbi:alpha/beta hydrolase [Actinomadura rupiterrae]|uniref:alpha/beta hydrolase n=1 Tax=Actinomadura rupiterrae TaxID=559627 RepID=UPI0020A551BF|nr:alpha/beta hydrolase [Actinomadura rupiterrae]MCP2339653.1 pimeloyl-ACP methyl ester carboxylesterase [Actinomadura rupiterrae]
MKKIVIAASAAVVAVAGTASAATAAPAPAKPKVSWVKCTDPKLIAAKADCGFVTVPLDYAKPHGKQIQIAISRTHHTDTKNYHGIMLGNPGGPGGSGYAYSEKLPRWLKGVGHAEVAAQYDFVGFDPRGVGQSKPALTCDAHYAKPPRPNYVPTSAKIEKFWLAKSKKYAQDCTRKFGWLLPHLRTTDVARDMDSIRAALGAKKTNYYGFSYGTYLGSTYATLFPKRVGRMVLDGNVNPNTVWYGSQIEQDKAFERNIKLWFAWLAKYDSVYHLGKTEKAVEALYYKTRAAALKKPIGGVVGGDELDDIVLNAGYYTSSYEDPAAALSAWVVKKDPKPLTDSVDPGDDDNGFAVYNAVQGADAAWPRSWAKWKSDANKLYKSGYRFNTWSNVWYNAPVLYWPFKGGPALNIHGKKGLDGILLVQSTLDAATPVAGGFAMHKRFPSSRLLLELGGKTHANTLNGNKCLDDKVAKYLSTGWLPKKGAKGFDDTCKADPALNDPNPTQLRTAVANTGKDLPAGRL